MGNNLLDSENSGKELAENTVGQGSSDNQVPLRAT